MDENPKIRLAELEMQKLEQKVDELLRMCQRLREENPFLALPTGAPGERARGID